MMMMRLPSSFVVCANLMPSGAFKSRVFFWRKNEFLDFTIEFKKMTQNECCDVCIKYIRVEFI